MVSDIFHYDPDDPEKDNGQRPDTEPPRLSKEAIDADVTAVCQFSYEEIESGAIYTDMNSAHVDGEDQQGVDRAGMTVVRSVDPDLLARTAGSRTAENINTGGDEDVTRLFVGDPDARLEDTWVPESSERSCRTEHDQPRDSDRPERAAVLHNYLEKLRAEVLGESWEERARRLVAQLERHNDKQQIGTIAYELGELYERRLADEARAVKAFSQSLQADPSFRPNLWAIRRVFYRRGLWPNLVKLVDVEVRFATDDLDRCELYIEKAQLLEDYLHQPKQAMKYYRAALTSNPMSVIAALGLERLAILDGDKQSQRFALRNLADGADLSVHRFVDLLELARLHLREGQSGLAQAREVLEEAQALEVEPLRAARVRVEIAEASGDSQELLEALESQIDAMRTERASVSQLVPYPDAETLTQSELQIVAWRRQQARIAAVQLGDQQRAWELLSLALEVAPKERVLLDDLADLAEKLGKYQELAALCEDRQGLEVDPVLSVNLRIQRAAALFRAQRREQADQLLKEVVAKAPGYLPLVSLWELDAFRQRDWERLVQAYEAAAHGAEAGGTFGETDKETDRGTCATYYTMTGDLCANYLDDAERAEGYFRLALEHSPGYAPAVNGLCNVLERTGKFKEAVALLHADFGHGKGVFQRFQLERFVVLCQSLLDSEGCVEGISRLLRLAPNEPLLRWRLDTELLLLERSEQRIDGLLELANLASDIPAKVALLLEAGRISDRSFGQPDQAIAIYRQVLALDPDHAYAQEVLLATMRRAGRWEDVIAQRRNDIVRLDTGPQLVRAFREAAEVLYQKLGRREEAIALYRELLDRMPAERNAVHRVASLYQRYDDSEGLREVLALEREGAHGADARASAQLRMAMVYEQHEDVRTALEMYRKVSGTDTQEVLASVAAIELAEREGEAGEQVGSLAVLASKVEGELQCRLWEEVGWLRVFSLGDMDRAKQAFICASQHASSGVIARFGVALVSAALGDVGRASEAWSKVAQGMSFGAPAACFCLAAARFATIAGNTCAAQHYAVVASAQCDHERTTAIAAEYLLPGADSLTQPGLSEQEIDDFLAQKAVLLGRRAILAPSPHAQEYWKLEQADVLLVAGRLREAGSIVAACLSVNARSLRALWAWRSICLLGGHRFGAAVASLSLADAVDCLGNRLKFLREAVVILDRELEDFRAAVPVYRNILLHDPDAQEFDRLRQIYRETNDWGGMFSLLSERMQWLDQDGRSVNEQIPLLLDRAEAHDKLGDKLGAMQDLSAVLAMDGDHPKALSRQAIYLHEMGDRDTAHKMLNRYLACGRVMEQHTTIHLQLAVMFAEYQNIPEAIRQLSLVLEMDSDHVEARELQVELLVRVKDFPRAIKQIQVLAEHRQSDQERARDELRIAGIYSDLLKDSSLAIQALERARKLDPTNVEIASELGQELGKLQGEGQRRLVLQATLSELQTAIVQNGLDVELYRRLAMVQRLLQDRDGQFYALQALAMFGKLTEAQQQFADDYRKELSETEIPSVKWSVDDWRLRIRHPLSTGEAADIWRCIAAAAEKASGHDPGAMGFVRGDKTTGRSLARRYPCVIQVANLFGLKDFDAYVSKNKKMYTRAIDASKPVLLLSEDVALGDTIESKFLLARVVAEACERTGGVRNMRDGEVVCLFAAAAKLVQARLPESLAAVADAQQEGFGIGTESLKKCMARRDKKRLADLSEQFRVLGDVLTWRKSAVLSTTRAALSMIGDLRVALVQVLSEEGGATVRDNEVATELITWAVGEDFVCLRDRLGGRDD